MADWPTWLRILVCLLLPLAWGIAVEFIFEGVRNGRAAKAANQEPRDSDP